MKDLFHKKLCELFQDKTNGEIFQIIFPDCEIKEDPVLNSPSFDGIKVKIKGDYPFWLRFSKIWWDESYRVAIKQQSSARVEYGSDGNSYIINMTNGNEHMDEQSEQQEVGHWIQEEVRGSLQNRCSICDRTIDTIYFYNYCPNCGEKMMTLEVRDDKH